MTAVYLTVKARFDLIKTKDQLTAAYSFLDNRNNGCSTHRLGWQKKWRQDFAAHTENFEWLPRISLPGPNPLRKRLLISPSLHANSLCCCRELTTRSCVLFLCRA